MTEDAGPTRRDETGPTETGPTVYRPYPDLDLFDEWNLPVFFIL